MRLLLSLLLLLRLPSTFYILIIARLATLICYLILYSLQVIVILVSAVDLAHKLIH